MRWGNAVVRAECAECRTRSAEGEKRSPRRRAAVGEAEGVSCEPCCAGVCRVVLQNVHKLRVLFSKSHEPAQSLVSSSLCAGAVRGYMRSAARAPVASLSVAPRLTLWKLEKNHVMVEESF